MEFISPLRIEAKGSRWVLLEPLVWKSISGHVIHVPADDVETDFFSIPKWAQWFLPKDLGGENNRAAVLHDHLYFTQRFGEYDIIPGVSQGAAEGVPFTREFADQCLLEAMEDCRFGWLRRTIIFYAVRYGGEETWAHEQERVVLEERIKKVVSKIRRNHG